MAGRSQEDVDGLIVSELVNSLKSAVQNAEKTLVYREGRLKKEIEGKNELQGKFEIQLSEKLRLAKECQELKELACRLREERDGLFTRLKEKEEIIELKRQNCELEIEKLRAKTDAFVYERRIKELEGKVLIMNAAKDVTAATETNSELMAGRSQEDVDGLTVSELVDSLKSAVQNAEKALVSREGRLKKEIAGKNELQGKFKIQLSEKLRLAKECQELKELACRLREERDVLFTRLKEKEELIEFKRQNCELEIEKLRAKTVAFVYERRIKELEGRFLILNVEKDASIPQTNAGKTEVPSETNANPSDGSSHGERTEDGRNERKNVASSFDIF